MKNLFLSFFILSINFCIGQTYYPVFGNSNEWYVLFQGVEAYETIIYYTNHDTIFKGNIYQVFENNDIYNQDMDFIREDTASRRIYIRYSIDSTQTFEDTSEVLLYDFSIGVGDSIGYKYGTFTMWCYVDSIIQNITMQGPRNFIYLHCWDPYINIPYYPVWIEGVGSICEFNYPYYNNNGFSLNCYYRDSVHIYQSDYSVSFGSCVIAYSHREPIIDMLLVFPNPAGNKIRILGQGQKQIVMTDLSGKELIMQSCNTSETELNVSGLARGIYIVKVVTEKGVVSEKVILQ